MKKLSFIIGVSVIVAACAFGGGQLTWTVSTGTNTTATTYADPFTGEIDQIDVYSTVATGAVSIAALDPFDSSALVLATNAAVGTHTVWAPRLVAASVGGDSARSVTNTATSDRFNARGEKLRAVFSGSRTGVTYRVRIKIK